MSTLVIPLSPKRLLITSNESTLTNRLASISQSIQGDWMDPFLFWISCLYVLGEV